MTTTRSFDELLAEGHRRWYRFGRRSPLILLARLRNKHTPIFRLKMAWQRATRGYGDDQLWNLNYTLATLTVAGIRALRSWGHGYPAEFSEPPRGDGSGWERWDGILAQIEDGFQAWLDAGGRFNDKPELRVKFDEAMALYGKWFGALWD